MQLSNNDTLFVKLDREIVGSVKAWWNVSRLRRCFSCAHFRLFSYKMTQKRRWHFVSVEAKEKVSAGRVQCPCKMINGMGHFLFPHSWASQKCWETITLRPGQSKEPSSQPVSFHLLTHRFLLECVFNTSSSNRSWIPQNPFSFLDRHFDCCQKLPLMCSCKE